LLSSERQNGINLSYAIVLPRQKKLEMREILNLRDAGRSPGVTNLAKIVSELCRQ